jgi:sugar lactone lactonase YvrE
MRNLERTLLAFLTALPLGFGGQAVAQSCTASNVVATFAGAVGVAGSIDGVGPSARFENPRGAAVDKAGNVYVISGAIIGGAFGTSSAVRKITPGGAVTTLAGDTRYPEGRVDGKGAAARFSSSANGLALDASGNLYMADGRFIRKITPDGDVSTLAGTTYGYLDGPVGIAQFYHLSDIALGPGGNIYVAEDRRWVVRKLTPQGMVSTVAGDGEFGYLDGVGTAAQVLPKGLAISADGNLFLMSDGANNIRKIDLVSGAVSTVAGGRNVGGGTVDGAGTTARFSSPGKIAFDAAGSLYVLDENNATLRRVDDPNGVAQVTTVAGLPGDARTVDGAGGAARFNFGYWSALAYGKETSGSAVLYLAESASHTVRKITCLANAPSVAPSYGLTFAVPKRAPTSRLGALLSCHGEPAPVDHPHMGSCNPYEGDTSCRAALPVACYRPPSVLPLPTHWNQISSVTRPSQLAATQPVVGASLTSAADGTALCQAQFGSNSRMAEFHDGGGWQIEALRGSNLNPGTRYWVHINDQPGNCWNR